MKAFYIASFMLAAFSLSSRAGNPDSASVSTVALEMMQKYPNACLGFESVPGLNETITGKDELTKAAESWEALGSVLSSQTDYALEVHGDDVLIRPKAAPQLHDGPVVKRPVSFDISKGQLKTIDGALSGVSFKDESQKFSPFLLVTSMSYPGDKGLLTEAGVVDAIKNGVPNTGGSMELSDALFLIARLAGANTWNYQASDAIQIQGKTKSGPRKLADGNLSFSGPR
mgnify:CR=1 FL=1